MLTANLLDVHDVAYLTEPNPVALSRVTLRPWVIAPECNYHVFPQALDRAMGMLRKEVPGHLHGMIIHQVQAGPKQHSRPASVATLRQYVSSNPAIGCVAFRSLLGDRILDRVILVSTDANFPVPRWVWPHLAATLLYNTNISGEAPA